MSRLTVKLNFWDKSSGIPVQCRMCLGPGLDPDFSPALGLSDHSRYFRENKFLRFLVADIPDPVTTSKPWHGAARHARHWGVFLFTGGGRPAQTNQTSRGHPWLHCYESTSWWPPEVIRRSSSSYGQPMCIEKQSEQKSRMGPSYLQCSTKLKSM